MKQQDSAREAAANVPRRRHKPAVRWLGGFDDLPTNLQVLRCAAHLPPGWQLVFCGNVSLRTAGPTCRLSEEEC